MAISGLANVPMRVHHKPNAPVERIASLPSTRMNPRRQRAQELSNTRQFVHAQRQEKGGSLVRGTEESDRVASVAQQVRRVWLQGLLETAGAHNSKFALTPLDLEHIVSIMVFTLLRGK
jgi:hypothetical protein